MTTLLILLGQVASRGVNTSGGNSLRRGWKGSTDPTFHRSTSNDPPVPLAVVPSSFLNAF